MASAPDGMGIFGRWRRIDALPARRGRDAEPGVYELADDDKRLLYIGQSDRDVPNRIRQHLLKKEGCLTGRVAYWRYEYSRTPMTREAELIDAHRKATGDLPPCNDARPQVRDGRRALKERLKSR